MPDVANIRNPRLGQALVADLQARANVTIHENCEVIGFDRKDQRVRSVLALQQGTKSRFEAGNFVLCAGAWTRLVARMLDISLNVDPVKGQMLLYQFDKAPVASIVLTRGRYAIPRRDGHLLVGSTLEHEQFDKTPTHEARQSLKSSVEVLLPMLKSVEPKGQWAGLRPAAPDGIPYIGKLPDFENFYVNAGQYRNGLVLAPASARLVADILLAREPIVDPRPYQPEKK
jgi:glycine oxidase